MKSLKTIQTIVKVFSILSLIGFIASIVGAGFSLIGVSVLSAIREDSELWQKILEQIPDAKLLDLNAARCASLNSIFYCAESAVLCGFSRSLFKFELSVGTPFDKRVSKRMLRDGIIYLAVPVGVILITSVISAAFNVKYSEGNYSQFAMGIAYLIISVICSYGAEIKEAADRNLNGNSNENPYDDFHNPY